VAEVRFVKEIPPKRAASKWVTLLQPLLEQPGRPAQIMIAKSTRAAQSAVDNLTRRRVIIPRPDHHWEFTSRENLVFAIYKGRGGRLKQDARVRRTKR
jgi:hypothetical protein